MERNRSLDGLKFILISLVVIGHFMEPSRYTDSACCWLYSVIYSFHMPLFIWMNGYFYQPRTFREELRRSVPLLEICAISHVCFNFIVNGGGVYVPSLVFFGGSPSWYLLSLVCWRVTAAAAIPLLGRNKLLIGSVLLEIVSFVFLSRYGGVFSIMRTLQFFPYFLIGYSMKQRPDWLEKNRRWLAAGALVSILFISKFAGRLLHLCEYQTYSLREMLPHSDWGLLGLAAFRYGYIAASLCIGGFILWWVSRSRFIQRFAGWGRGTLFVYYAHIFLFALVCRLQPSLTESLVWAAATVAVLTYVSGKDFSRILMNPGSTLLRKMKML